MPIVAYQHSLTSPGYAPDMAHGALPPQAWTDGANMRFHLGAPRSVEGFDESYSVTTSVIFTYNVYDLTSNAWVCATTTALMYTDGTTVTDITRRSASSTTIPYTGTADLNWTAAPFGNFLVLNNGADVPQSWSLTVGGTAVGLTGWPATWDRAGSVRAFRNYLVAMDISISSTQYPSLVAWSDAAPYDTLPTTWTPVSTNDAGDNNLNDTPGWCIDGMALGGSFIIYKEDAIWAMSYVGGATVMAFRRLFDGVGLLSRRCVQEFNGQHFFVGRGDIYVTDGVQLQSVAAGFVREKIFGAINPDTYQRTFTAIDRTRREIWVCYADGTSYPNTAMIWNYETKQWYPPRTMAETAHMAVGIEDTAAAVVSFAASAGVTIDADDGKFDVRGYNPSELEMLACIPSLRRLYRCNSGEGLPSETVYTNILTYSQAFDNVAWSRVDCTVSATLIASPIGTMDGYHLVDNTANLTHGIAQSMTQNAGEIWTVSGHFKADGTGRLVRIQPGSAAAFTSNAHNLRFDPASGLVLSRGTASLGYTVEDKGGGWWRVSNTAQADATFTGLSPLLYIIQPPNNGIYVGDGSGFYVWGIQLQKDAFSTDYIATTSAAGSVVVSSYTVPTGYLSRKLLPFVGKDARGGDALWGPAIKTIRRLWLDATGTGTVNIYLGVHAHESSDADWHGPYTVNLSRQNFVWTLLRGRFFSIKFETVVSDDLTLTGYKLEWEPTGGF